ncbi:flavin monoamine oxidase family protein [Comamonas testosteroni]|uniref:flavin monoamine oxidase family protein n=1 Tax=Comamonas testosteroni TaxID=285 RepID=UPI0023AA739A|nr:flavin monoamine oxidase family protein [Comamonas testosteroni]WEE77346.1 flavin monoamine oxidase family protein [Comamonas testosteroni]
MPEPSKHVSRRQLLSMIGKVAGGSAMYQAMSSLGYAAESHYSGPVKLGNAKPGASVLVLGAGLAGMVAAHELRAAGYKVQLLEYQSRAGGRCWTLRGGDEFSELDGTRQQVGFAKGNYFNPGPWRVPYHHHAMLDYYKRFGIKLEAFNQVNYNAYLHNSKALAGKPQRFRHVQTDVYGHVAELLSKATNQGALDQSVSREDKERLLESLKAWGVLDKEYRYRASNAVSDFRGYDIDPGGGLMAQAKPSTPMGLHELLESNLWRQMGVGNIYEFHSAIFQPEGGMDMLAQAMARDLGPAIRYNAKVTRIAQNDKGVTVDYVDALKPGSTLQARADWCVCTIPLSILSQIEVQAGSAMQNAIAAVPYGSSMKVGLEFKRRFWEEDERIYGGISYTDLPIQQISYPSTGYMGNGPAVLLGAYAFENSNSYRFSSLKPAERVRLALEYGAQIHPQYKQEFLNGVSVAWHRMPWINGCFGNWTDALREQHYKDLAQIDGRLVLAGEHVSYIPAWQEGAVLSSLDAIQRLHAKASSL